MVFLSFGKSIDDSNHPFKFLNTFKRPQPLDKTYLNQYHAANEVIIAAKTSVTKKRFIDYAKIKNNGCKNYPEVPSCVHGNA
ncbi:MAG: hypothetical protein WC442_05230 [Candidatus Omnitrophota bacterium]